MSDECKHDSINERSDGSCTRCDEIEAHVAIEAIKLAEQRMAVTVKDAELARLKLQLTDAKEQYAIGIRKWEEDCQRLREDLEREHGFHNTCIKRLHNAVLERNKLRKQRKVARANLIYYAQHRRGCEHYPAMQRECTCGLEETLRALDGGEKGGEA